MNFLKRIVLIHLSYSDILSKMFKAIFILTRIYYKEKVSRLSSPPQGLQVITCDYYTLTT